MVNIRSPGLWLLVAGLEMLFLERIAEFIYPGYDPAQQVISALGVGPTNAMIVFVAALLLFGAMALVTAWLLRREQLGRSRVWIFLGISGVGAIGVAIFNMDDFSIVHAVFALLAFIFGNLASIFSYRLVRSPLSWIFVFLGLLGLAALVLFGTDTYLGIGRGGMERLIFYPPMLWALGYGAYLLAQERIGPTAQNEP